MPPGKPPSYSNRKDLALSLMRLRLAKTALSSHGTRRSCSDIFINHAPTFLVAELCHRSLSGAWVPSPALRKELARKGALDAK